MVTALKQNTIGQVIAFHQRLFAVFFQIPCEKIVVLPLGKEHAYGVFVLVARYLLVVLLVENIHRNSLTERITARSTVFVVPTFKRGIMLRPCLHFGISKRLVILTNLRSGVCQRIIDNRSANKAFKHAVRRRRTDKACDMILVSVRRDNVFQHTIRTILLYIRYNGRSRALSRTCINQHFRISRLDKGAIPRVSVADL